MPVVITEGEFKTLALCRAAEHRSLNAPRFLALRSTGSLQLAWNDRQSCRSSRSRGGTSRAPYRTSSGSPGPAGRSSLLMTPMRSPRKRSALHAPHLRPHLRSRGSVVEFLEVGPQAGERASMTTLLTSAPDAVLDEIAHVDFAGCDLEAGPPSGHSEAEKRRRRTHSACTCQRHRCTAPCTRVVRRACVQ